MHLWNCNFSLSVLGLETPWTLTMAEVSVLLLFIIMLLIDYVFPGLFMKKRFQTSKHDDLDSEG